MKYVTIRLLVDDHRAGKLESALETTTRGDGYIGISVEPDILHGYEVEDQTVVDGPAERVAAWRPRRRIKACVENWPEADTGAYDPRCCRFPKSCSATVYDPERVSEDDLEEVR